MPLHEDYLRPIMWENVPAYQSEHMVAEAAITRKAAERFAKTHSPKGTWECANSDEFSRHQQVKSEREDPGLF